MASAGNGPPHVDALEGRFIRCARDDGGLVVRPDHRGGYLPDLVVGGRPAPAKVTRTFVRYPELVTDVPRRVARRPRSLTPEQLTHSSVTSVGEPVRVSAWIVWEDGVEELLVGHAVAWTPRAVQVRFGVPPHQYEMCVGWRRVSNLIHPSRRGGRCVLG